jgi:hypothetical protein
VPARPAPELHAIAPNRIVENPDRSAREIRLPAPPLIIQIARRFRASP